jgi:hypothetical protein
MTHETPGQVGVVVRCAVRIQLVHLIFYPRFSWFFSASPGKFVDGTSIRPRPLPSEFFPIHYSPINLPFDGT